MIAGSGHERMLREYFPRREGRDLLRARNGCYGDLKAGKIAGAFGDGMRFAFWLAGSEASGCCRFAGGPYLAPEYLGVGLAIATKAERPGAGRGFRLRAAADRGEGHASPSSTCAIFRSVFSEAAEDSGQACAAAPCWRARSPRPSADRPQVRCRRSCSTRSFLHAHFEIDRGNLEGRGIGGVVQVQRHAPRGRPRAPSPGRPPHAAASGNPARP